MADRARRARAAEAVANVMSTVDMNSDDVCAEIVEAVRSAWVPANVVEAARDFALAGDRYRWFTRVTT